MTFAVWKKTGFRLADERPQSCRIAAALGRNDALGEPERQAGDDFGLIPGPFTMSISGEASCLLCTIDI
jgi:hypothetical protein